MPLGLTVSLASAFAEAIERQSVVLASPPPPPPHLPFPSVCYHYYNYCYYQY